MDDEDVLAEGRATLALEEIAELIVEKTSAISHWGSGVPFEGVCENLAERARRIAGVTLGGAPTPKRKRKVFGLREGIVIFKRDGYRCVFCGSEDDLTIDHIIAWSKGGSDEMDNLQTLCGSCNSSKGDR